MNPSCCIRFVFVLITASTRESTQLNELIEMCWKIIIESCVCVMNPEKF